MNYFGKQINILDFLNFFFFVFFQTLLENIRLVIIIPTVNFQKKANDIIHLIISIIHRVD